MICLADGNYTPPNAAPGVESDKPFRIIYIGLPSSPKQTLRVLSRRELLLLDLGKNWIRDGNRKEYDVRKENVKEMGYYWLKVRWGAKGG